MSSGGGLHPDSDGRQSQFWARALRKAAGSQPELIQETMSGLGKHHLGWCDLSGSSEETGGPLCQVDTGLDISEKVRDDVTSVWLIMTPVGS